MKAIKFNLLETGSEFAQTYIDAPELVKLSDDRYSRRIGSDECGWLNVPDGTTLIKDARGKFVHLDYDGSKLYSTVWIAS